MPSKRGITYVAASLALLICLELAAGACINNCNDKGNCNGNLCECSPGWVGNDCSQRSCPFHYAHVTTHRGDLNFDGDRVDNSLIPLSQTVASLTFNTAEVTFSGNLLADEITVGDGILIDGEKFIVLTHTAGSNTMVLDKKHTTGLVVNNIVYRLLEAQVTPAYAWETWPGDAANDEGHFYMECSNRGQCNRKTGSCQCFAGYEGNACQRTTCPNSCSGHGTCETISSLRKKKPALITTCTVEGNRGEYTLTASADCSSSFTSGDKVIVGDHPLPLTVSSTSHSAANSARGALTTITLSDALPKQFVHRTPIYLQARYELWDADMNRACLCDPKWTNHDCSWLKCPVGDNAVTGGQQWETQVINVGGTDPTNPIAGSFKLLFTDMYGEEWSTKAIPAKGATDYSADLRAALMGLPHSVIADVRVQARAVSSTGMRYRVQFNGGTMLVASGNSGDLPLMGCDARRLYVSVKEDLVALDNAATATVLAYETATDVGLTASTTGSNRQVLLSGALSTGSLTEGLADGDTVLIGEEMRVLLGNHGSLHSSATSFLVDHPFSAVTGQAIARVGTAKTDYRRQVKFTTATAPSASVLVPGGLINIGGLESRTIASVTLSGGKVTALTVTQPWLSTGGAGSKSVYSERHISGRTECTVSDVFPLIPATWGAAYVRGTVMPPSEARLKDSGGGDLTATTTAGSTTVTLSAGCVSAMLDRHVVRIGTELRALSLGATTLASGFTTFTVNLPFDAAVSGAVIWWSADQWGSKTLTFDKAIATSGTVRVGDRLYIPNNNANSAPAEVVTVETIASDGSYIRTANYMNYHVQADVNGDGSLMEGALIQFYGVGDREQVECSGQGLCNRITGLCTCFEAYALGDCSGSAAVLDARSAINKAISGTYLQP